MIFDKTNFPELPKSWVSVITSDTFTQISTTKKKIKTKDVETIGKYPVVDQGKKNITGYYNNEENLINLEGSPVIVFGDHTRIIKYINFNFIPGADGIKIFTPKKYFTDRLFYYFLRSVKLPNKGYSRHFKFYKELKIAVPPLAEQTRIANKLDKLLTKLDTCKTRLDSIPNIIKQFRQSVLLEATSGKLTESWRKKNKPINSIEILLDEIFQHWSSEYKKDDRNYKVKKIVAEDKDLMKLPESWGWSHIGTVFDVYIGATPSRKIEDYWKGDINWISSSEVAFCRINNTKEKITKKGLKNTSTKVHPKGTVMLAMIGQGKTRGQPAILDIEAAHNQNTAAIRVADKYTVPEYLYYYLYSEYENTRIVGAGNNQKALNKTRVQSLHFPLPPFEEQKEIVSRIEALFTLADQAEAKLKIAQQQVDNLTQSILAKAFRGELVPQDPNDEPAEKLLERIKQQREADKPKKKVSRPKVKK